MLATVTGHFAFWTIATFDESHGALAIPIVAIVCVFAVKALKVSRRYPPVRPDVSAEDRAKIGRITEIIDKMESRVAALETLLREEQTKKAVSHEEAN